MATNDKETSYAVTANVSQFIAAMRQTADASKESSEKIKSNFEAVAGSFEKVAKALGAVTALLAGGAAFASAISATKEWGASVGALSRQLGVGAQTATAYKVATEELGIDAAVLTAASDKLAKQMAGNTQAFDKLGISTKDANGAWRTSGEVLPDVLDKLRSITNPTQQAIAGQALLGKAWGEFRPLLKLTGDALEEAKQKVIDMRLAVDPAQVKAYSKAMHGVELITKSLEIQVGSALMPTLTKVGEWFAAFGPEMADQFATAIDFITKSVATLIMTFEYLGKIIGGVLAATAAALTGNFSQARQIMSDLGDDLKKLDDASRKLWETPKGAPPILADLKPESGGPAIDLKEPKAEKEDKSRVGDWETELAQAQIAYQTQNNLREISKGAELEYWQAKRQAADLTDSEIAQLDRKVAETRLSMLKEMRATEHAIAEQNISETERAAFDGLDARRQAAQEEQQLGITTKAQLLAQEKKFEDERLVIAQQALQERISLLADDPERNAAALNKLNNELEDAQRQHNLRVAALDAQLARDSENQWKGIFDKITSGFTSVIQGLVNGTQTITQAFGRLFLSVADAAISMAVKMGAQYLLAAAQRQILGATTRSQEAVGNANVAAGAAYASTAAIPVVGPALAPAAAASALAATLAFVPGASAMGGFDIPQGLNPITQLHQNEMVLPAHLADPIRDMAARGGDGGGDVHLHVHAIDSRDARRFLLDNHGAVADSIRRAHRNAR